MFCVRVIAFYLEARQSIMKIDKDNTDKIYKRYRNVLGHEQTKAVTGNWI